jgi:HAD superfamily hydrolase (TIGR01484 family)
MKEVIIFDLDGTLNTSKMPIDEDMVNLLCKLLTKTNVAVISGASFTQFEKQFINILNCADDNLNRLFLMPTSGGSLYKYEQGKWTQVYKELLSEEEVDKIHNAFDLAIIDSEITLPVDTYGEIIEDRGSQVTYSALGQEAPIEVKEKWDHNHSKREKIVKMLTQYIPEFEVRIGGTTSIDVTKKGIDKAYGIEKLKKYLDIPKGSILFIGDAVFPGGNDYSVKKVGIETIQVSGQNETKKIIREFLEYN